MKKNRLIIVLLVFLSALSFALGGYGIRLLREQPSGGEELAAHPETEHEPIHTASPVPVPAPRLKTDEPVPSEEPINAKILWFREEYGNEDIIGYLKIDGTSIDYPVTQYFDNEFYLEHGIDKNPDAQGWIFLDYENDVFKDDKNTVIYGHNMNKDIMFHALRFYEDEDFYKEHRFINFDTVRGDYIWEIFSFYRADVDFYYIQVNFESDGEFGELAKKMKAYSLYDTGVMVNADDRVLTLSTCTNEQENTRFVLNAKLVGALHSPSQPIRTVVG